MKTKAPSIILATALAFAGCRRSDLREMTVDLPGLKASETNELSAALCRYQGVRKDTLKWIIPEDGSTPTLTLRFDSLLIAEMNILKTLEAKGCKVALPELQKGKPAGYINTRKPEIEQDL
ncbi:MAG: hypothetical protein K6F50_05965 [Kiritimatiellae bacterium]|nr:hypothetical protein [Kiritimatiellia bacterium]